MHAKGFWRPSATTNSMIIRLSSQDKSSTKNGAVANVWCSYGQPCKNEYQLVDWPGVLVLQR